MNRNRKPDSACRPASNCLWVRWVALMCCVVWGAGGLRVLPALVAFLGAFDSTHQVLVVGTRAGTEVVFHHQTKDSQAPQKHSVLMRIVATVAATSGESNDHVLDFANAEDWKAGTVRMSAESEAPPRGESFVDFRSGSPIRYLMVSPNRNNRCNSSLGCTARTQRTPSTLLRI